MRISSHAPRRAFGSTTTTVTGCNTMNPSTTAISADALRPQRRGPLLERLRNETAEQHRALESIVDISRRLQDRDSYRKLLADFYGFYRPLELRLGGSAAAGRNGAMLGRFEKSRWLAEDLAQLGIEHFAQLPQCTALPSVETWPRAIGTMYVLEGSTLGGRHISALLNGSSGAALPRRFFTSYDADIGMMWRSFCAVLEGISSPDEQDAAADNARATFESMRVWLRSQS